MKFLGFFAVLSAIVAVASAVDNPGTYGITNDYLQAHFIAQKMMGINALLGNQGLNRFNHEYYMRPQETQALQIEDLLDRIKENSKLVTGHSYPYSNQISIDPNVVARLINAEPTANILSSIAASTAALSNADKVATERKQNYLDQYSAAKSNAALQRARKVHTTAISIEDALHQSKLRETAKHGYSTPFNGGNMDKVLNSIKDMEHKVRSPLSPMQPNAIEITAMNRLSDKLEKIAQRVHQKPLETLHQDAHAQDVMLERAANLIRSLSQSVESGHQDQFLSAVHQLLHKHHLHDHKFLSTLEDEVSEAVANGTPLRPTRTYETEQAVTPTPTAVNGTELTTPTPAPIPAYDPTAESKAVSRDMEAYGRRLIERSDELSRRADIIEGNAAVPQWQREALQAQLEQRLNSPPAQVHVVGAARPLFDEY